MNPHPAILFLALITLAAPCWAAWETTGAWTVSADDHLSVASCDQALAWNPALAPGRTWSFSTGIRIHRAAGALRGSAKIVFADRQRHPQLAINLRCRGGQLSIVEVETFPQSKPKTVLTSNYIPGNDEAFWIRLCRAGNSVKVTVYGDKNLSYSEQTPDIPLQTLDTVALCGLEAETAGAEFSSIRLESPWKTPSHFVEQAESAVFDLLTHFWSGGLEQGCILPTMHGYSAPNLTDPRGGLWERAMMAFALDTLHRATGDPTLSLRLKAEWARLNRLYTPEELEAAGGPLHPACDDTGWDALYYLTLSRHSGDHAALDRAQGLVNNAFRRWLDDELGGGMWYSNERSCKSLYQTGVVLAALRIAELGGNPSFRERAQKCYDWMEEHLLRDDGLYWCDRDASGPRGANRPDDIHEAGSVVFLGGNMGMGVLHARLYRLTGEKPYLDRALRTANAIARTLTAGEIYLDDRDAWANGTFAGDWAQEVLSLPGTDPQHKALLRRTADSIHAKARTSQGYYGGSWSGPAEGPGSAWCRKGSRPQQIMTSASSVNIIAAAASTD